MQPENLEMQRRAARRAGQQIAREAAHHGHHGADREIEPRHQHRHGLGHGQHGEREDLVAILHQHGRGEALRMRQIVEQIEDAEQQDGGDEADILAQPDGEIVKHGRPRLRHGPTLRHRC